MDYLFTSFTPELLLVACIIAILAGIIKGMVGFGMPMILISGLSSFLSPELALAGLILPTVVTNAMQTFRYGLRAAAGSVVQFRVFLGVGAITLLISAQFVRFVSADVFLLLIGVPIALFALMQLFGVRFHLEKPTLGSEILVGGFAGVIGGISGVWGPPTVAYLTALGTEKTEQMRVQGVIYGLGAVLLVAAHLGSGILRADTALFSLMLVPPAVAGMWLGGKVQDRIDQATFRKATLVILVIAALNLIRRALIG